MAGTTTNNNTPLVSAGAVLLLLLFLFLVPDPGSAQRPEGSVWWRVFARVNRDGLARRRAEVAGRVREARR